MRRTLQQYIYIQATRSPMSTKQMSVKIEQIAGLVAIRGPGYKDISVYLPVSALGLHLLVSASSFFLYCCWLVFVNSYCQLLVIVFCILIFSEPKGLKRFTHFDLTSDHQTLLALFLHYL